MASVTFTSFGAIKQWKFAFPPESGDVFFEVHVEAPQASRHNEWLQFLLRPPPCHFVLNRDDGVTKFSREDTSFGFTYARIPDPGSVDLTVCAKMTPELLEHLRQLPFSE